MKHDVDKCDQSHMLSSVRDILESVPFIFERLHTHLRKHAEHNFFPGEQIQVIDDTTGIWTPAKVLGFNSDWSITVKWTTFPS
jgi:hypothetical protein